MLIPDLFLFVRKITVSSMRARCKTWIEER